MRPQKPKPNKKFERGNANHAAALSGRRLRFGAGSRAVRSGMARKERLMAQQFDSISDKLRAFIEAQKIFFTGSAAPEGRVNVSPKGMDSFRVLGPNRVAYLDLTGSGSETWAHVHACADRRLTVMFCAFEGPPMILRLYGAATIHQLGSPGYDALLPEFTDIPGARQIVVLDVDLAQTSCGFAVPLYDYREDRPTLVRFAEKKGEEGMKAYRAEKNAVSLDGLPAGFGTVEAAE